MDRVGLGGAVMPPRLFIYRDLAARVINTINANANAALGWTTYAVGVVLRADGQTALMLSAAGRTSTGIPTAIYDAVQAAFSNCAVINVADGVPGDIPWHYNDAERQLLGMFDIAAVRLEGMLGSRMMFIQATRDACDACAAALNRAGFVVVGTSAYPNPQAGFVPVR